MISAVDWLPSKLKIREVGPREGFQSISTLLPTEVKIRIIDKLVEAGLTEINIVSFVSSSVNPQVADSENVIRGIRKPETVVYSALVLNPKGLERAEKIRRETGCPHEIIFLMSASEAPYRVNGISNKPLNEYLKDVGDLIARARSLGFKTNPFVSAAFGCSIDGPVDKSKVLDIARRLVESGADRLSISDSTGQATPDKVVEMYSLVKSEFDGLPINAHFHDARGFGIANILVLMGMGIKCLTVDSSFGGLGGVPAMPGAVGNIATEDLVSMCDGMGVETNVDIRKVIEAAEMAETIYGRVCPSRVLRVGPAIWQR